MEAKALIKLATTFYYNICVAPSLGIYYMLENRSGFCQKEDFI